jgi:hypothetical protein
MLMSCRIKVSNRRGIAPLVILIVLVLLIVIAYVALSQLQTQSSLPVKIKDFGIQPSTFKTDGGGQLSLTIENVLSNDSVTVTMYLETHENVKIYQGGSLLPVVGGNYTLVKQLDPSEISELKFAVKGTIDVGDNSRDYYIREYCFVGNVCYDVQTVSLTIQRS